MSEKPTGGTNEDRPSHSASTGIRNDKGVLLSMGSGGVYDKTHPLHPNFKKVPAAEPLAEPGEDLTADELKVFLSSGPDYPMGAPDASDAERYSVTMKHERHSRQQCGKRQEIFQAAYREAMAEHQQGGGFGYPADRIAAIQERMEREAEEGTGEKSPATRRSAIDAALKSVN